MPLLGIWPPNPAVGTLSSWPGSVVSLRAAPLVSRGRERGCTFELFSVGATINKAAMNILLHDIWWRQRSLLGQYQGVRLLGQGCWLGFGRHRCFPCVVVTTFQDMWEFQSYCDVELNLQKVYYRALGWTLGKSGRKEIGQREKLSHGTMTTWQWGRGARVALQNYPELGSDGYTLNSSSIYHCDLDKMQPRQSLTDQVIFQYSQELGQQLPFEGARGGVSQDPHLPAHLVLSVKLGILVSI